jgi:hypothetical protein
MRNIALLSVATLGITSSASAELIYGVTAGVAPTLVTFDSATPGTVSAPIAITGITVGQLRAIDFRPATGGLYGMSYNTANEAAQLYTIDTTTGAASAVGSPITLAGTGISTRVSIDFNPTVDRLRVVTGSGTNYRVNPITGALAATDGALNYAASTGLTGTPLVAGVAYTNNVPGATTTTLYAYEFVNDLIMTIIPPNSGVLNTVGSISPASAFSGDVGFDISGTTGTAYISLDDVPSPTGADEFYTVNLATGSLSFVGTSAIDLLDISAAPVVIPEPATLGLAALAIPALLRRRRA